MGKARTRLIWQDTKRVATCRRCRVRIVWATDLEKGHVAYSFPLIVVEKQPQLFDTRVVEYVDVGRSPLHDDRCIKLKKNRVITGKVARHGV
jgi:hypothetical protein